jgi:hypothetical protein
MKLTIQAVPPSLNKTQRMHWAKRKRLNDEWKLLVRAEMPQIVLHPFVKMRCCITLAHSRAFDKDNAYGACKPVVDALTHWKLIFDDSLECLDLKIEQVKCSRSEAHTVIELEPA